MHPTMLSSLCRSCGGNRVTHLCAASTLQTEPSPLACAKAWSETQAGMGCQGKAQITRHGAEGLSLVVVVVCGVWVSLSHFPLSGRLTLLICRMGLQAYRMKGTVT